MNLRAKLITSFGALLLGVILVFAAITYGTFSGFMTRETKQVLKLKAQTLLLQIEGTMDHEKVQLRYARERWSAHTAQGGSGKGAAIPSGETGGALRQGIFGRISILADTATPRARRLAAVFAKLADGAREPGPRLVRLPEGVFLAAQLHRQDGGVAGMVLARLEPTRLRRFLSRFGHEDRAQVVLSLHGELLGTVWPRQSRSPGVARLMPLLHQSWRQPGDVLFARHYFVFTSRAAPGGLQVSYLLPRAVSHLELSTLKDRLVAAILILGYLSVWLVLVIAYRISRPISDLCQASRDIISFNYETPVKMLTGNDEIGALGASFETMRRKIKELVSQDSLTRTYNRRHLMNVLCNEVERAVRHRQELSCLMIDLDHFKRVNDRYGHRCGDEILETLSGILMDEVRSYDTLARYGGEEFTVLLPDTGTATAQRIAERLRQRVENFVFQWQEQTIRCTLSVGIATSCGGDLAHPELLIEQADQALYAAKAAGRNRIMVFQAEAQARAG